MERTALELLDKLIDSWNFWDTHEQYYLTDLAPSIVRSEAQLTGNEKKIVTQLRDKLSPDEWTQLPRLIAERRSQKLDEFALIREREEEAKRREAEEQERTRANNERKQKLMPRIQRALDSDFLTVDQILAADPDADLISRGELDDLRMRFVQEWVSRELGQSLDSEQAAAVGATEGDIEVILPSS